MRVVFGASTKHNRGSGSRETSKHKGRVFTYARSTCFPDFFLGTSSLASCLRVVCPWFKVKN